MDEIKRLQVRCTPVELCFVGIAYDRVYAHRILESPTRHLLPARPPRRDWIVNRRPGAPAGNPSHMGGNLSHTGLHVE